MTWVKLDDQFADHPKALAAGPLASWLFVCGLTYCARYLTDGFIPAVQVRRLADLDNAVELAERLVHVGLWDHADGGYHVHDYLDYQPCAAQVRSERQAARERMRAIRADRSPEVRPNISRSSPSPSPIPDPISVPPPSPVDSTSAAAAETSSARAGGGSSKASSTVPPDVTRDVCLQVARRAHLPDVVDMDDLGAVLGRYHARDPAWLVAEAAAYANWVRDPKQGHPQTKPKFTSLHGLGNWLQRSEQTLVKQEADARIAAAAHGNQAPNGTTGRDLTPRQGLTEAEHAAAVASYAELKRELARVVRPAAGQPSGP